MYPGREAAPENHVRDPQLLLAAHRPDELVEVETLVVGLLVLEPVEDEGRQVLDLASVGVGLVREDAADFTKHGKLDKARSRLYRSQILQVNTRWNSYLFEKKIEKRDMGRD